MAGNVVFTIEDGTISIWAEDDSGAKDGSALISDVEFSRSLSITERPRIATQPQFCGDYDRDEVVGREFHLSIGALHITGDLLWAGRATLFSVPRKKFWIDVVFENEEGEIQTLPLKHCTPGVGDLSANESAFNRISREWKVGEIGTIT